MKTSLLLVALMAMLSCKSSTGTVVDEPVTPPATESRPATFASDDAMLDYIQRVHFNYMWDGAEPISGLARERIHLDGDYPEHDQMASNVNPSSLQTGKTPMM